MNRRVFDAAVWFGAGWRRAGEMDLVARGFECFVPLPSC